MPLKLERTKHLLRLSHQGTGMGIEQPRHLHGQRGAPGDDAAIAQVLPCCPRQGQGIDARVVMKPTVFVSNEGVEIVV